MKYHTFFILEVISLIYEIFMKKFEPKGLRFNFFSSKQFFTFYLKNIMILLIEMTKLFILLKVNNYYILYCIN